MNFMKWGYAAFLFVTALMLGLVLTQIGLIAAMVLHSVADAVVFVVLRGVARASVSGGLRARHIGGDARI